MKDCTTCKYGYEDERLGIPMCHHPKRFSEDCIDFNMHEEKEIKESEKPVSNCLEEAAREYAKAYTDNDNGNGGDDWEDDIKITFIAGAKWQAEQILKEAVEVNAEVCKLAKKVWINPIDEKKFHQDVNDNFRDGDKVRVIIAKED